MSAVVFCQGCPWRCGYCHNPHLLPFSEGEGGAWKTVHELLKRRQGLLNAVVFSGGEPTAQESLPDCAREAREMGFAVGLHTGGAFPYRLESALPWIDWVGLDIKARFEDYRGITGSEASGRKALESLHLLLESHADFECRTTVHPVLQSWEYILDLGRLLAGLGVRNYSVQAFRSNGCADAALAALPRARPSEEWRRQMEGLFHRFTFRDG